MKSFEFRSAPKLSGWLWVPLAAMVAIPFPAFSWPLPERALPICFLLLAGAGCIGLTLARASWPFAALFAWMIVRAAMMQFPERALQLLLLISMVGLLYVAARELSASTVRLVAWAILIGAAWEFAFGVLNLFHVYPWMTYIQPGESGRPMGFLTHPNYWGSYMALVLPVVLSLVGVGPALAIYAVIAKSYSGGPVISASVALAVAVWPMLGRRARYALIAVASAVTTAVMTVHEWRLSGRREVWQAIWPELMRYPIIGQGLGSWRIWADHYNAKASTAAGKPVVFATLQAHNEPYQMWFELGLIGVVLIGVWAWQAWAATRQAWVAAPQGSAVVWWKPGAVPLERAWIALLAAAVVNSFGSPTFHLPAQAALTVFALARIQAAAVVEPPAALPPSPVRRRKVAPRSLDHATRG